MTPSRVILGDLFTVLRTLEPESVDAVVTDPPYGIGFMGREWDTFKPERQKVTRKTTTAAATGPIVSDNPNLHGRHRSPAVSPSQIEYDFTIRGLRSFQDWSTAWALEVFRVMKPGAYIVVCGAPRSYHRMTCGLEDAGFVVRDSLAWLFGSGFPKSLDLGGGKGTALKPAYEPIALAWKPFKGTLTDCHAAHGTAALNIAACAVGDESTVVGSERGRWPANVAIDDFAAEYLDATVGELRTGAGPTARGADSRRNVYGEFKGQDEVTNPRAANIGGPSRFYYCAKPSRAERDRGCESFRPTTGGEATHRKDGSAGLDSPRAGAGRHGGAKNTHPTVKPVDLMRWLVRLVSPAGGVVLDPFCGSGTTGMACAAEGRRFIGVEKEPPFADIARRRIATVFPLLQD